MCELLGIAVEPAAVMGVYFHAFRPRAKQNQSGWGVGWYEDGKARVVKEAKRADHSEKALELARNQPMSDLFVIHVREATVGEVSLANCHPFTAKLRGREWIWAHNGTVHNRGRLRFAGFTPAGTTDSEIAFYHLLNRLTQLDDAAGEEREAEVILEAGRELSEGSRVNFLLSDGRTLYAYHDGHKTLHFVERSDESGEVRIADDEDYEIDLKLPAVAHDRAVIVASVPLTSETWTPMDPGDFLVCRQGRVVDLVRSGPVRPAAV